MEEYGPDRRRFPRFALKLRQRSYDFSAGREIEGSTCDLSNLGIGFVADRAIPSGAKIDIWLYFPDNSVAEHINGTVVWMYQSPEGPYRMGVSLSDAGIRPIPLVLKSIQMRSRYYC